ncbi:hypothetical protein FCM35_KLT00598 [Carex littledalei]|uniref:Neprosin PEP catalytic domain-containing protein n=1 Tax=Carex littledalei TaxID=544730 RepID=A0A833R3H9_9POAL|nr:hypothetical protein FCM35_KLT00598 [Carex littledalei]
MRYGLCAKLTRKKIDLYVLEGLLTGYIKANLIGSVSRLVPIRSGISQDEKTGDWSLYREDPEGIGERKLLGWWPGSLFKSLSDHAEIIQWTGVVSYGNTERTPSMGSGRFASELNRRAASFTDCFGFDANGNGFEGKDYKPVANIDIPACYSVSEWYHTEHSAQRDFILFLLSCIFLARLSRDFIRGQL